MRTRGQRRVTVMISSVACEGMRLSRPDPIPDLKPGTRINIRLLLNNEEITLPGQVAWSVSANDGETHVGISLWLEAAAASARQVWSSWIVSCTKREQASAGVRDRNNNVVAVGASAIRRATAIRRASAS